MKHQRLKAGEVVAFLEAFDPDTEIWVRVRKNGRFQAFPAEGVSHMPGVLSDGSAVLAIVAEKP